MGNHEDFIDWLACAVFEDDWDENPGFYREVILRKLVRMGFVELRDNNYHLLKPKRDYISGIVDGHYDYKDDGEQV